VTNASTGTRSGNGLRYAAAGVGLLLMVVPVLVPFYTALGLAAPLWVVAAMLVLWVVMFITGLVLFRRRPFVVLALPFVALAVCFAVVYAGDAWWGWTA
jgi:small-conductance mechanosensitive channel